MGHKVSIQGFPGPDALADTRNYHTDLRRDVRTYHEGRSGPQSRPHVLVGTAKIVPVKCHATYQRILVVSDPDRVP